MTGVCGLGDTTGSVGSGLFTGVGLLLTSELLLTGSSDCSSSGVLTCSSVVGEFTSGFGEGDLADSTVGTGVFT